MDPAVRLLGTVDDWSTTKVRSVPSVPRTTSQLVLEETTVPDIVDSVPAWDEDIVDPDCWDEDGSCVVVPVVEPVWAASDPATPRLRAAPRRNAYRLLMLSSSSSRGQCRDKHHGCNRGASDASGYPKTFRLCPGTGLRRWRPWTRGVAGRGHGTFVECSFRGC